MTNQQKAERCGEFVRDGLDCLSTNGTASMARYPEMRGQLILTDHPTLQDDIVEGARQAGHWGRLALAEILPELRDADDCKRRAIESWAQSYAGDLQDADPATPESGD